LKKLAFSIACGSVALFGLLGLYNPIDDHAVVFTLLSIIIGYAVLHWPNGERSFAGRRTAVFGVVLGHLGLVLFVYCTFLHTAPENPRLSAQVEHNIAALENTYSACQSFAGHHGGRLPETVEQLVENGHLDPKYLKNFFSSGEGPGFVIVAAGVLADRSPDDILAIETVQYSDKPLIVLRCDGSVLRMEIAKVKAPSAENSIEAGE